MPRVAGRRELLRPGWIVASLFTWNPLWWVLGLGGFVWSLASIPLWVWIIRRPGVRRPPMVGLFIIFIGWTFISAAQLDRFTRLLSFSFRATAYLSALGLAIYVYNERRVSRDRFIRWVAWFWVAAILGGYLALVFPYGRIPVTPASLLLPGSLQSNDFLSGLVRPEFAQVQTFLGFPLPRPMTLFKFTNDWGGNVGLLTPFFIASFVYSPIQRERRFGAAMLAISVPPIIVSVNRGLWISVTIIFVVLAFRSYRRGHTAPMKLLGAGTLLLAILLIATPLRTIVTDRLSSGDASTRAGIYSEAWEGTLESPFIGYGGPRPSTNPFSPAIGTHGQLWLVMFSNGFVGLAIYVAWALSSVVRSLRHTDIVSMMLACTIIVGAVQMGFYSLVPVSLPIILTAIGLIARGADERRSQPVRGRERELVVSGA